MIGVKFIVKGIVAYLNYGHMHAFDSYCSKCIQLTSILNKIYLNKKETYICCAYILQ